MATERIDELSPREFLEHIIKTPYPLGERVRDVAAIVIEFISQALSPSFLDPFAPLTDTMRVFSDYDGTQEEWNYSKITAEKVEQVLGNKNDAVKLFLVYDNGIPRKMTPQERAQAKDKEDAIKKRLLFILETTHELAKKMGLTNIEVLLEESLEELVKEESAPPLVKKNPARGGVCGGRSVIVLSFEKIKQWDDDQLKFVIAHELAHTQHQDTLKPSIFDGAVFAINLFVSGYFKTLMPFGIGVAIQGISHLIQLGVKLVQDEDDDIEWHPLLHTVTLAVQAAVFWYFGAWSYFALGLAAQGLAKMIKNGLYVYREQTADEKAMQLLNSNTGAILLFHSESKVQYRLKHTAAQEMQKDHPELSVREIINLKRKFTPYGKVRIGHTHPALTERLRSALNFRPTP
jgi:Zn-dependent protease with chaperone function